jgi:hypothetical protein
VSVAAKIEPGLLATGNIIAMVTSGSTAPSRKSNAAPPRRFSIYAGGSVA